MPMPRLLRCLHILAAAVLMSGCPMQPKPLSADQLMKESQGMAQLSQRHRQGEDMVKRGQDLVKDGQAKQTEGQRLIDEGQRIIQESEQGYEQLRR